MTGDGYGEGLIWLVNGMTWDDDWDLGACGCTL